MSFKLLIATMSLFVLAACSHGGKHHGHHKGNKGHHKDMWKKMDANSDGSVTREEFDKMHGGMFDKMDANKDGKITKEEMMAKHKEKMGKKGDCCGGDSHDKK